MFGEATECVSERQVICPHVAPAIAQLKNIFGYMRCKQAHICCICDTYAQCGTSAEAERKQGLFLCVCMSVCMCRQAGAWVCSQHLLRAREIVSECHIKIT